MLAPEYGGRSSAIRQALRHLAADRKRQNALPLVPRRLGRRTRPDRRRRRRHDGRAIRPVILDAGFLISIERSERTAHTFVTAAARADAALHTTHPVVAQVWRTGSRQARLSALPQNHRDPPTRRRAAQSVNSSPKHEPPMSSTPHLVITAVRLGQGHPHRRPPTTSQTSAPYLVQHRRQSTLGHDHPRRRTE